LSSYLEAASRFIGTFDIVPPIVPIPRRPRASRNYDSCRRLLHHDFYQREIAKAVGISVKLMINRRVFPTIYYQGAKPRTTCAFTHAVICTPDTNTDCDFSARPFALQLLGSRRDSVNDALVIAPVYAGVRGCGIHVCH